MHLLLPSSYADVKLSVNLEHLGSRTVDSSSKPILIVFINGLILPQTLWTPTITLLTNSLVDSNYNAPVSTLTYDRYGQGQSRGSTPDWIAETHDIRSAADELATLLDSVTAQQCASSGAAKAQLILVSQSIGCPLARIFDMRHPHRVSAHVFLDSNIANTDFVSLFPDPDAGEERWCDGDERLPENVTVQELRAFRERTRNMFHPSVPNREGLDRSALRDLLPHAGEPALSTCDDDGSHGGGKRPFLTVVGHDPVAFAEEGERLQGTPRGINYKWMQPAWEAYNAGLLGLSEQGRVKGVLIAPGAGHFVQRDNPQMVVEEVMELVGKVVGESLT